MGTLLPLSKSITSLALNASEILLLIFGIVLAIGIVGEYKLPSYHHRLKRFELLVVIGVAGELFSDGGIFFFSRRLQTISDLEVADLTGESVRFRLKAAQLEERLAGRTLNQEDRKRLADAIRPFGPLSVDVVALGTEDREVRIFCDFLSDILTYHLRSEGWNIACTQFSDLSGTAVVVSYRTGASEKAKQAAEVISFQLSAMSIPAQDGKPFNKRTPLSTVQADPNLGVRLTGDIRIIVGRATLF